MELNIIYTIEEINSIAKQLLLTYKDTRIWLFDGNMGAGKTTLIAALCKRLNSTVNVSSPTFSIINTYVTNNNEIVNHMDWYRLSGEEEAINAGVEEALYEGKFCWIEWPEKAYQLIPFPCVEIKISTIDEFVRKIETRILKNDSVFN